MNASHPTVDPDVGSEINPDNTGINSAISLDDKYTLERGRAFMTGTQALIRLSMLQRQADVKAGLNTAGYITGYRGSPLGAVDTTAAKAKKHLTKYHVKFHPGVNEDLAATSVWGTQQVNMFPGAKYDGVFALWYGKGPGVDRCGDVFKHANLAGTSPHGGVLVIAGDDHAAKSSTAAHQSEHILKACGIPVLYPSSVQEYLDYGLHGIAMSRYTGLWVAMKCVTDVVESGAVVEIDPDRVQPIIPTDFKMPDDGVHIRTPDPVLAQETRMNNYKWYAALAYARANKLNKIIWDSPKAKIGIITAGKSYLDTRQALADLGIDEQVAQDIGIRLYKIGLTWPLESDGVKEFASGLEEILVVEEKRQILEYALKEELYHWDEKIRPHVVGKFDDSGEWSNHQGSGHGAWLLPATYELSPAQIARAIASRISRYFAGHPVEQQVKERVAYLEAKEILLNAVSKPDANKDRIPHFCSGCPHNTSTKLPEGSRGLAGIGCHYMVTWMDRESTTFTQMGGEGVTWVGQAPFTNEQHVFSNLGDGTYYHSGSLAIRAAIAAQVNITYKILFNDAVAMTGGQEFDGPLDPGMISRQIAAEGVSPIIVVTDEPEKYPANYPWAAGVTVRHRSELDAVQRELRECKGVSGMIYDQTCASEKRRRRKKFDKNGKPGFPDPAKRAVINEAVCEGCGDCSVQSNCLSVEPLETEFGRKRQINQSSCNKDYSCVTGFCPSFVTVEGGKLKKPVKTKIETGSTFDVTSLPHPVLPSTREPYGVIVTGVGGTGVITIGQIMAMAAHLQGKACSVLDMTGLAQKGGAVMSHVRLADKADDIQSTRVGTGMADLVIGCDLIVTAGKDALSRMGDGRTQGAINSSSSPTATFIKNPNWQFPAGSAEDEIRKACGKKEGKDSVDMVDATTIATALMGDSIASNMFMLGYAWQKAWVPLTEAALMRAIELNGVQIDFNKQAFNWGRVAANDLAAILRLTTPAQVIELKRAPSLEDTVAKRISVLTDYQNAAYAQIYADFVAQVKAAESAIVNGKTLRLTEAVAKYLFKLMAYKDEYEVARLYTDGKFQKKITDMFEGDYSINFHLAPPLLAKRDNKGQLIKQQFGPWMMKAFGLLAKMKGLRGSALDIFGYTEERQMERSLPVEYRALLNKLLPLINEGNLSKAVALASIPEEIRGYGHVKERHFKAAKEKEAKLLAEFGMSHDTSVAA
ncbi:MAG: indolepyruvate ferredoxin oxidoreductase family protein [Undibacterium sp.]|nr:indolepyruvate ferredoxin oxidoreductase family protein [Undibacterium sp.]